jgi:uncharacterized protein
MPWDFWVILFVLAVLIPWRGRARLRRLLSMPVAGTREKLTLYGSTVGFQWLLAALVAWRAFARGLSTAELGLARRVDVGLLLASAIGAALLCTFQWFNLRRVGRMNVPAIDLMRKLAERLLPARAVEFGIYCVLSVTAGICEEFLYRGFVMAGLSRTGAPMWSVVVISSIFFGLAHAYQGKGGMVGTGLLGVIFAGGRLIFSSLVPVMAWHAAVDITAGIAGPKFLLPDRNRNGSRDTTGLVSVI